MIPSGVGEDDKRMLKFVASSGNDADVDVRGDFSPGSLSEAFVYWECDPSEQDKIEYGLWMLQQMNEYHESKGMKQ